MVSHDGIDILLLVGEGWGVRTFLQTAVLPELRAAGARVAVLAAPPLVDALRLRYPDLRVEALPDVEPRAGRSGALHRRRQARFRQLASTVTRRHNRLRQLETKSLGARLRAQVQDFVAGLTASPDGHVELARRYRSSFLAEYPHRERLASLLDELRPALVVSTVPHAWLEVPPVLVAQANGIPTVGWINSWDNPTSKGAYPATFDHYFVWSETLADQLRRNYPETAGRPVEAVGVPHFDWYRQPSMLQTRAELFARLGLDPERRLVLYGTATPFLAPREHRVVERLARDLATSNEPLQLLVRLHPADSGARFADLKRRAGLALDRPGDPRGGLQNFCPTDEENRRLVSSVTHADVVVNLASSLTLDAAVADRPAVNVAFGLGETAAQDEAIQEYYRYDHYRTVVELGAARLARTADELVGEVRRALAEPDAEREKRRALVDLWCGEVDGGAGTRLARRLADIARPRTAVPHV